MRRLQKKAERDQDIALTAGYRSQFNCHARGPFRGSLCTSSGQHSALIDHERAFHPGLQNLFHTCFIPHLDLGILVQNHVQQGFMDFDFPVVFN
jgi:hypothetical protein